MQIITNPCEMQNIAENLRMKHQLIAVVMTMGALHEGHLSLIKLAKQQAGTVILTIFVNPAQFGENEDFHCYPRPFEKDSSMARAAEVDYLFAPDASMMYPEGFQTGIHNGPVAAILEGEHRPDHFNGVSTVVLKLMMICKAHIAVFGEKDAQQLAVIKRMTNDLNIDIRILEAPLLRDDDGVAISSRNIYLSSEERKQAAVLFRALSLTDKRIQEGCTAAEMLIDEAISLIEQEPDAKIDYVSIVEAESFTQSALLEPGKEYRMVLAIWIGTTRLIDNRKYRVPLISA
ncbi:MAG: pantoate--beta-alanine ligase [Prosthecochloris sp.]|uniref:pantoate--beta-alanine ligase n=1 Tax=Prosthecochloris sp. TaxID=290513 RepID=UPI00259073B8|nr:pantoate--beta-alanine ligase [Prosthecochloris sp.]MCW8798242.1 pantoate--beta-alanine ligase [Prosthecochloris sp.]